MVFLSCSGWVACAGLKEVQPVPASQNPSPMQEGIRVHERIVDKPLAGLSRSITGLLPKSVSVFVPESARDADGVDILIHFHGAAFISNTAVAKSKYPIVAVNVHLGAGSAAYERPFLDETVFPRLVRQVKVVLDEEHIDTITPPRVFLSGFSAGSGAIRAILRYHVDAIDGVLLLDGLHTDYVPDRVVLSEGGALNTDQLEPFLTFAKMAVDGEKRLLVTHSEIFPGTFSSTTETTDYLISVLGLQRTPVLEWGPVGMQLLSRTEAGRLTILGFAGNTAPDHVDHFHGLPEFLPLLTNR